MKKKCRGQEPKEEPLWYVYLHRAPSDTNSNLDEVVSDPAKASYVNSNYEENKNEESFGESEQTDSKVPGKQKVSDKGIMTKLHQKRKFLRSQTQVLSEFAGGMRQFI